MAANARALALLCLITASLTGCDRAPAVVQHPTGPNRAPADASPIVADSAPTGLSADRLAAWTAARRTLADAKVVYRLGALEGDGPEVFGRIADVALDGENKLLVLDGHSQRVSVFGPSGQFLERFGRSGDGPEELRGAYGIAFEPSGDLLVVGTGRQIKVFGRTASGWQHRETRPLPLAGGMACVTNSGRTIVAGADTRSDRNVLLHEVPGGVGGQVRSCAPNERRGRLCRLDCSLVGLSTDLDGGHRRHLDPNIDGRLGCRREDTAVPRITRVAAG